MKHVLFAASIVVISQFSHSCAADNFVRANVFPNYDFAASSKVWDKNPFTYMVKDTAVWAKSITEIDISSLTFTHSFKTWPIANPYNYDELKSTDCGNKIIRGFEVNASTVYFTLGRSPEMCSSPPAMRWRDNFGKTRKINLIPASNWNVVSFWQSGDYLVFGLDAQYETTANAEALGIWNLKTGAFDVISITRASIGIDIGNWKQAQLATTDTAVILQSSSATVAFITNSKKTTIVSPLPHIKSPEASNK